MLPTDSIYVTTGATSVRHFMSEAVVEFRVRNPRTSFKILSATSSEECLENLRKGEADLAWVTISDPADGVEQHPVLELPWALAMRAGEPYSDRAWIEVPELSGLRLVRLPRNSLSGARLAAALANVTTAEDAGVGDWDAALQLAELGIGHAIVPRIPGPSPNDSEVRLVPLRGLPPLPVGWAVRSGETLPPLARTFAETVIRNCRMKTP